VKTFEPLDGVDDAIIIDILAISLTYAKYSMFSMTANEKTDVSWWLVLSQCRSCRLYGRIAVSITGRCIRDNAVTSVDPPRQVG
jgi:hypothetical protein